MEMCRILRTGMTIFSLTTMPLIVSLAAVPQICSAMAPLPPSLVEQEEMVQLRQAGLHGDHSRVPAMIEALQHPAHPNYVLTSLLALAQLGATDALPAIDGLINDNKDQNVVNFAKAARARLVAEDSAKGIKDSQAQAAAEVNRFYQELGLTSTSLNAGVAAYEEVLRQNRASPVITMDADPPVAPIELFAMRELADMAYQSSHSAFASLPDVAVVDFGLDPDSALKVRLAPLPHDQRIATMLDEMIVVRGVSPGEVIKAGMGGLSEAQLLADEGATIAPKIKVLQQEGHAHPERYRGRLGSFHGTSGLGYLGRVLEGAEGQETVAVLPSAQLGGKPLLAKRILRRQLIAGY